MTYERATHRARLYLDGRQDAEKELAPKRSLANRVARIGFTAPDFPAPASYFDGRIAEIRLYKSAVGPDEVLKIKTPIDNDRRLVARWCPDRYPG